ncbi:MAG: sigma-54-dependent Fis family transcriptional regulator [Pirellulaceae bacterium]|nr:sigma-54-dependent Fis family transcriptional regulator [Pirellulaceae bacterium]
MSDESTLDQERPAVDPREFAVLIVDNDKAHARAMTESLEKVGYRCTVATSGPEGISQIERGNFQIVVSDLVMNDADGMQVLQKAKKSLPDCEVILVTGHASVPTAVEAMQEGAFNFLEKPITPNRLRAVTAKAVEAVMLKQANTELRQRLDEKFGFEGIIFASPKMTEVIDRIKRIAPTDATVLITGESGTGKEMIAQAIHQNSPRKHKRLKALNVRAVSEQLVESELFGHVKGAFTDAATDRVGAFEYTDGGSLFLDEVGDMPMSTQIKLLRVLEEHRITRVGDNKAIKVNVRLISATNRPLETMVQQGTFRNDLYYRLNIVTVHLPPLRERREDVVPLMDHFRKFFLKRHGKNAAHFAPAVRQRFFDYDWPGNIRQLRNFVETMVVLDTDGVLDVNDLPPELSSPEDLLAPRAAEPSLLAAPLPSFSDSSLVGKPLEEIELWAINETLKLTNGNRKKAAEILKIGERTLYRKLDSQQPAESE